jgi:4-hydroxyphenylpyruvate dioxygenase
LVAYAGPETGVRDRASYVLKQNKVTLVLTTSLDPDSEISDHVRRHGDGVKVLALWVDDAEYSFHETVKRGAKPVHIPELMKDEYGEVKVFLCSKLMGIPFISS